MPMSKYISDSGRENLKICTAHIPFTSCVGISEFCSVLEVLQVFGQFSMNWGTPQCPRKLCPPGSPSMGLTLLELGYAQTCLNALGRMWDGWGFGEEVLT